MGKQPTNESDLVIREVEASLVIFPMKDKPGLILVVILPKHPEGMIVHRDTYDEGMETIFKAGIIHHLSQTTAAGEDGEPAVTDRETALSEFFAWIKTLNQAVIKGIRPFSVFIKEGELYVRLWEPKPEKIRKSVNFARQTQGDAKRARKYRKAAAGAGYQLALEDLLRDTKDVGVKVDTSGIVLSSAEKRLAHGLTVLLAATGEDEKGYPLGDKRAEAVNQKGEREITGYWLFVSANELLEAANYERLDNGRYPQSAKNQLNKTLDSLRINQHKLYVNGIVKGEKFSYTHGVSIVPIVERINFEELPKSKAEIYDKRETFYRIQLHSIWTDKLDTLWLNVPKDIYLELNKAKESLGHRVGGRGYNTHAVDLLEFILSLSGKNIVTNKLTRATIAERLRLSYLVENRHTLKLDEAIAQAFEELQYMGYISKWEQVEDVYHFEKVEK